MFEHLQSEEDNANPKGRTIHLMQNGKPDYILKMHFVKPITKIDIAELV